MKEVIPYFALLLFSAMLMMAIIFYSWKKHAVAGALPLVILALCGFFWTFGYAFEILGISFAWMVFWHHVKLLGMMFVATAVLYFTLEYAGHYQWTRRPIVLLMFTIPFVIYIFNLFNAWHEWMYVGEPVVVNNIVSSLVFENGWLGALNIQYNFLLVILSGFILAQKYFYSAKIYRKQIMVILLGVTLPFLGAGLSLTQFGGKFGIDYASFLMVLSGLVVCWGVFRYHLLDLVPITHTAVLASIQDGVIVVDSTSRIVDINPAVEAFFGSSLTELLGQPVTKLFPNWQPCAPDCNTSHVVTMQFTQDDGFERYFEIRCKPLQPKRQGTQGQLLIVHDITDRKLAEKLMAERTTLLEKEVASRIAEIHLVQEKSEIILHNIQDAIGMSDLEGHINYVNSAFVALTGYEEAELLGMYSGQLLNGLLPEPVWAGIKQVVLHGVDWQGEIGMRRKNGRTYMANMMIAPVKNNDGQLVGYVSSHHDVSQEKDLEKARSQFINNISHELRTPVTNLKLYMQLMQYTALPEKRIHYEQVMGQQVERLEKVIQDILEISAIDLGSSQPLWQSVDTVHLVAGVVDRHHMNIVKNQLTLSNLPLRPNEALMTHGDYEQLQIAICKLMDNAIRFTPQGGHIRVTMDAMTFGGQEWITVAVNDDGLGILAEDQSQIFKRFYRGEMSESGHIPGTGLGLSVAEHIARLHGGSISVESELGKGSTFTMRIPKH